MDVKKLIVGHPIRLKYVTRFSTCRTIHKESVAEHCYFTTLFALVLGEWARKMGQTVNFRKLLHTSIIHDLEESITGDIPRDFKHGNLKLNNIIDQYAEEAFKKVASTILQNPTQECNWFALWKYAKEGTIEGNILSLADFMSVVSYIYEEYRISKSTVLQEQLTSLEEYGRLFLTTKFLIFKPIINQLIEIVKEILNASK